MAPVSCASGTMPVSLCQNQPVESHPWMWISASPCAAEQEFSLRTMPVSEQPNSQCETARMTRSAERWFRYIGARRALWIAVARLNRQRASSIGVDRSPVTNAVSATESAGFALCCTLTVLANSSARRRCFRRNAVARNDRFQIRLLGLSYDKLSQTASRHPEVHCVTRRSRIRFASGLFSLGNRPCEGAASDAMRFRPSCRQEAAAAHPMGDPVDVLPDLV